MPAALRFNLDGHFRPFTPNPDGDFLRWDRMANVALQPFCILNGFAIHSNDEVSGLKTGFPPRTTRVYALKPAAAWSVLASDADGRIAR